MMMTNFKRSTRAISPIFATLILIAIAVIAGIVVYMFTSGYIGQMTGGGTAGQEKVAIQSVGVTDADTIVLYCQSTGGGDVTVDSVQLKFAGNASVADTAFTVGTVVGSSLTTVTVDLPNYDMIDGTNYMATLISAAGGSFNSPTFKGPA